MAIRNVISFSLYYFRPILKISSRSVHSSFSNVADRQTDMPTNKQSNCDDKNYYPIGRGEQKTCKVKVLHNTCARKLFITRSDKSRYWLWYNNKKIQRIAWNKCTVRTPLWKSNRNFSSTQFFYHLFFVVCSSFYTWYMWGGQYQFCNFLLEFDHWLYINDILKKVTRSKPDVALVWFIQWAKMELEHGEKDRYWCIVRV